MTWSFLSTSNPKTPVNNSDLELLIEPNERGGWSLRFAGESIEQRIGNYPTPEDAARVARANCSNVRIVEPVSKPLGIAAIPTKSLNARLAEISY